MRRLAHLLAVAALSATALVTIGGAQVASGQTGPIGYSSGLQFTNGVGICAFWSIDLGTGTMTQVSDDTAELPCADGLTFGPDGTLFAYVNNEESQGLPSGTSLVTIDPATGAQTPVGELPPVSLGGGGMTFDGAGNLWLYGRSFADTPDCAVFENCLWRIDPATADASFIGAFPQTFVMAGLAGDCTQVLAVTEAGVAGPPVEPQIQTVDTATGALGSFAPPIVLQEMRLATGLDFDDAGTLWALGGLGLLGIGEMQVANIDVASGAIGYQQLFIDGNPEDPFEGFLNGLAVSPISCPVPPPPPTPAPEVVLQPTFTG